MTSTMKTGVLIGGTGAQGVVVVKHLTSTNEYHLKVITRSIKSPQARQLGNLPNVTLVQSESWGYDEDSFYLAAEGADFVFINTDGFAIGEIGEIYWGIRFFELARRAGVKHFIYSSLDNVGEPTNYDPKFHVGHYYSKARVVDFLRGQPPSSMKWSVITSGPYVEMLHEFLRPTASTDGDSFTFKLPLGKGKIPFIHLDDFARYVAYIIANPNDTSSQDLKVATVHATGDDIAQAFTAVTGKMATYIDTDIDEFLEPRFSHHRRGVDTPIGLQTFSHMGGTSAEKVLLGLTWRENFTAFFNVWRNGTIVKRDYEQLDRILPDRVRSVEEWMKKVEYTGESKPVLKGLNDALEEKKRLEAVPTGRRSAWG